MKQVLNIIGNVKLEVFDVNGYLKDEKIIHNVVTDAGKAGIVDQVLTTPSLGVITHMELGTGSGGTLTLNNYIAGSRTAFTSKTRNTNVLTIVGDFPAGVGTGSITEAGTFDTNTENAGNMWMYATFTAIEKTLADTLKITWTLTAS